ncbi:vacuolar protein sorting-associated protein 9A-like isoform X2 [Andrographis paniculata]|nr:vacuolar protein sorting-associated protein 9A-like isoform X2 [Andrographis paniculata]
MEAAFRAHPLWAGSTEEELESAGEGLEKYVMTKLFTRVFASIPEDVKADEQLNEKMALIQQFVRPENLDIKPTYQNETSWLLAQKELQKINMYKAPRDKLVCILNCCKVINNLLLNASLASSEDHPGADEFLPVLIYVTIKANPPQLHSNLAYIQRFRLQTRLAGEAAYFFTNMLSVESFITNINAKALSMDDLEFEKNMESAQALLSGLSESSDNFYGQTNQNFDLATKAESADHAATHPHPHGESSETKSVMSEELYGKNDASLDKAPSITDLENKGAALLLKEEEAKQIFVDFPYLYSKAGDLMVSDIDDLLNNYRQLVIKYVCLARGLGVAIQYPSFSTQVPNFEQPESEAPKDLEIRKEAYPKNSMQRNSELNLENTNSHKQEEASEQD